MTFHLVSRCLIVASEDISGGKREFSLKHPLIDNGIGSRSDVASRTRQYEVERLGHRIRMQGRVNCNLELVTAVKIDLVNRYLDDTLTLLSGKLVHYYCSVLSPVSISQIGCLN